MNPVLLLLLAACSTPAPAPTAPPAHDHADGTHAHAPADPGPADHAAAGHGAEDHGHTKAHGGEVKTVGTIHVEAVMVPSGVLFYLSDAAEKPLMVDGYGGSAVIKGPTGVTTAPLMAMGDHLHATAALTVGAPASVVLTLTEAGKAVSASWESPAVGLAAHDHTALHGGQVGMWGDHHVEYVAKDGTYRVWVTDSHRRPVAGVVTGTLKDGDQTLPLAPGSDGSLETKGAGAGTRPVMVDVTVDGTAFSLSFNATP